MTTKMSLLATARNELDRARASAGGRSATTLYGGHERTLRQTLIALCGGEELEEHESPGEATLYVVSGRVRLTSGEVEWVGMSGDLLVIPEARHALAAAEDAVVLLTVAKPR